MQLARLAGAALFLTALGDDDAGRARRERAARRGVDVHAALGRASARAAASRYLDADGERTITILGPRIVPHGGDPLPWDALGELDGVYFTGGDARGARPARARGVLVATPRALDALLEAGVELDALVASASDAGEARDAGELDPAPRVVVRTEGAARRQLAGARRDERALGGRAAARAGRRRLRLRRLVRRRADVRPRRRRWPLADALRARRALRRARARPAAARTASSSAGEALAAEHPAQRVVGRLAVPLLDDRAPQRGRSRPRPSRRRARRSPRAMRAARHRSAQRHELDRVVGPRQGVDRPAPLGRRERARLGLECLERLLERVEALLLGRALAVAA